MDYEALFLIGRYAVSCFGAGFTCGVIAALLIVHTFDYFLEKERKNGPVQD